MDLVYLDNNATTKPAPEVVAAILPYLEQWYGNPSSVHRFGQRARQGVDIARGEIASLIGAAESEITFTGGGTEAVNTAIRGVIATRAGRKRVITTTVEHSATRELLQQLAKEGHEIVEIPVNADGELDIAQLEAAVDEQCALVTVMWANNETGVVFPVSDIVKAVKPRGVPLHVDATQAIGKIPASVKEIGADLVSFAAHKFHGPKGIGALYVRRGMRFRPLIIGGPQETNRRGGTENVPGIIGMGAAARLAGERIGEMARVARQRDRLEQAILHRIPTARVNGMTTARIPNTTNIGFHQLEAEAILLLLSEQGICASAGAACSSGSLEPSHVLRAMGIDERYAHGAIRFSLSRYTTDAEIDRTLAVLPGVIDRLRAVLPVG